MADEQHEQRQEPEAVPAPAPGTTTPQSLADVVGPEGHTPVERTELDELMAQRRQGSLQVTREQAAAWQGAARASGRRIAS